MKVFERLQFFEHMRIFATEITTLVFPCFASFLVKLKWELNVEYCAALAMLLYRFRKKQYF